MLVPKLTGPGAVYRVDLKDIETYQQVYTYIMAIITNMAFINVMVVVVRLWWFKRKLVAVGKYPSVLKPGHFVQDNRRPPNETERTRIPEPITPAEPMEETASTAVVTGRDTVTSNEVKAADKPTDDPSAPQDAPGNSKGEADLATKVNSSGTGSNARITFAQNANKPPSSSNALYVPPPWARDNGKLPLQLPGPGLVTC